MSFHARTAAAFRKKAGMALMLVLSALLLLSALVTGMLVLARQQASTAGIYAAGAEASLLADSAVNVVISQIQMATADAGSAWISQPGLIRTFGPEGARRAYKLYSSGNMVVPGAYDPAAREGQEVPSDWHNRPREYVDLNRPVELGGRKVYPIADPAAGAGSAPLVEGFEMVGATRVVPPPESALYNELPMPVRWLYLMANGTLLDPSDPASQRAVARLAFWTDDETCKVNINTASGGVFFDTPAANTREEHMLGRTQPVAQEYQRWPGHPATTSLAPVLRPLRALASGPARSQAAASLTPRIAWGGSQGGTAYAWRVLNQVQLDTDRLFATADELAFGTQVAGGARQGAVVGGFQLDAPGEELDRLTFFLTAQSRAPELNLFHRPRVTLWPFNRELVASATPPAALTPEDRLIRFASELGGVTGNGSLDYSSSKRKRFYFQRVSAWEPGRDWDEVAENRALFRFLQRMTELPIPASAVEPRGGASFREKLGSDHRDQLLVNIWDYLRANLNTNNQAYVPVGRPGYSFPQGHTTEDTGYNDIAPLVVNLGGTSFRGPGRHPVPAEFIFQFYNAGESLADAQGNPVEKNEDATHIVRKVRMVLLINFHNPVMHLLESWGRFQLRVRGPSFGFDLINPVLDPDSKPVAMRNPAAGFPEWVLALPGSIGFPGERDTAYVSTYWAGERRISGFGGTMGIALPMLAPIHNMARADNKPSPRDRVRFKVFANRLALSPEDSAQAALFGAGRQDIFYPFVSDVVEFLLPKHPTLPRAANADGHDYFQVFWQAGDLEIECFAGLRDGATALSPTTSHWQPQNTQSLLWKTTLPVASTVIPLPRRGPDNKFLGEADYLRPSHRRPSYSELTNYYQRANSFYRPDFLILGPNRATFSQQTPGSGQPVESQRNFLDVLRSYTVTSDAPVVGDLRLLANARTIPATWWEKHPLYDNPGTFHASSYFPIQMEDFAASPTAVDPLRENTHLIATAGDSPTNNARRAQAQTGRMQASVDRYGERLEISRVAGPNLRTSRRSGSNLLGDFTTGYGSYPWGSLVLGPDLGAIAWSANIPTDATTTGPYFSSDISRSSAEDAVGAGAGAFLMNFMGILFSPYKQMPSPVILGTLPARAAPTSPAAWETLLFNPMPAGGRHTHRGWTQAPRDHFLLDLFYMPCVEPYAITENFATAGKVNLNYQIAPFTYIRRTTALRAVLDGMTSRWAPTLQPNFSGNFSGSAIFAVPDSDATANSFRVSPNFPPRLSQADPKSYRRFVSIPLTLQPIIERLEQRNDPFVSASEICEIPLIPEGETLASLDNFWGTHSLTGDDKREMPYNHLLPRLTTRSNTFRVHYWVQALRPAAGSTEPIVTGEARGSVLLERYLDPNLEAYGGPISDGNSFDVDAAFPPLHDKYRFRKVEERRFTP